MEVYRDGGKRGKWREEERDVMEEVDRWEDRTE